MFALDGCELDGGAAALDGGVLDGGTLDCGTLDGGARFFDTLSSGTLTFDHSQETCSGAVVWSTAARSARHAHDGGALDGGALDGGALDGTARSTAARSTAVRSTAAHARRRCTLDGGMLEPRQRHSCRRMEFFSCFTELLQSPSLLDAAVITRHGGVE